jgi:hypothetical protein
MMVKKLQMAPDPLNSDTDGDGVTDGQEKQATDPNDNCSLVVANQTETPERHGQLQTVIVTELVDDYQRNGSLNADTDMME